MNATCHSQSLRTLNIQVVLLVWMVFLVADFITGYTLNCQAFLAVENHTDLLRYTPCVHYACVLLVINVLHAVYANQ